MIALFDHGNDSRRPIRGGRRSHPFGYPLGAGVLLTLASACTGDLLNLGESDRPPIGDGGGANNGGYQLVGGSAGDQQAGKGGAVSLGGAAGASGRENTADSSSGAAGSGPDAAAGGGTGGAGPSASGGTATGTSATGGGATAGAGGSGVDDNDGGCFSGECAVQLAYQEYAPINIAVDGEHVYWMTEGNVEGTDVPWGKLYKVSKHGGPVQLLWTGEGPLLRALMVDSTHVYFTSSSSLLAIPKSGGDTFKVFDGGNAGKDPSFGEPWGVAMTSEHIYWTPRSATGDIRRVAKAGGPSSEVEIDDKGVATILAVHDDYLYWNTIEPLQSVLYRAALPNGPPQRIAPVVGYVRDLVVAGPYVFAAGQNVVRYSLSGEAPVVLSTGSSHSIEAHGGFVYWAEYGSTVVGTLRRARFDENVSTVLVREVHTPLDMTLDAESLYWLEYRDDTPRFGRVMKFPR
jgi:hypothetical protein